MPRRCAYLTRSGRPCIKVGIGNPPLCRVHRLKIEGEVEDDFTDNILDRVLDHPTAQGAFNRIAGSFDRIAQYIDVLSTGRIPRREREEEASSSQPPPRANGHARPVPPPPRPSGENPYLVLGFTPGVKITAEMVKERRKELAKLFHPDKQAGSTEAMKRVNTAAETLLARLK